MEIRLTVSAKTLQALKKANDPGRLVDKAVKQYAGRKHIIKQRLALKKGYRIWGKHNLRLCRPLAEDKDF